MPAHRPIDPPRQSRSQFCATLVALPTSPGNESSKPRSSDDASDPLERCNPDGLPRKLAAATRSYPNLPISLEREMSRLFSPMSPHAALLEKRLRVA